MTRQIKLGKNALCSDKNLTGHDVVKICIWGHHLILTTHRKSGPLPFTVLTQMLPLQLSTSTSECSDIHRPYLRQVFFVLWPFPWSQKGRTVWASSTSFQLTLSKSKHSTHANLGKTSPFSTSPLHLKSYMFPQNGKSCFNNYHLSTRLPGTIFTLHVPAHLILTKTPGGKHTA